MNRVLAGWWCQLWQVGVTDRPVSLGGRAFQGRWVFRLVGSGGLGLGERGADRAQAVAIAWAQRQVASMRRRSCRAPRVMRAATCSTR